MKRSVQIIIGTLFLTLLTFLPPAAQAMLRCGNQIITPGDPQAKVAAHCGEPVSVKSVNVLRAGIPRWQTPSFSGARRPVSSRELLHHQRSVVQVPVEIWLYNLGPNKLMKEVEFEEGRVVGMESLGYGY
jgi:hypothetical protein